MGDTLGRRLTVLVGAIVAMSRGAIPIALVGALLALASCGAKAAQNHPGADGGRDQAGAGCGTCGANQVCVGGSCMDIPSQCPCPKETYCDLGMGRCVAGCTSDDLCDTGRICFVDQRKCMAGCRGDPGCAAGQICDQMMCHAGCRDDSGCTGGQICDQSLCRAGCRADSGCAAGQICDQTTCHPGCRDDSGCAAGQICEQSLCRAGCRQDADCGAGKICDAGTLVCRAGCRASAGCPLEQVCDTPSAACVAGCDGDARCVPGHICQSARCITGCRDDTTCPTGQRCFNQICRSYCLADTDCPLGQVCVGNQCTDGCSPPNTMPDTSAAYKRCPPGTTCRWSGCTTTTTSRLCQSSSCVPDCSGVDWSPAYPLTCNSAVSSDGLSVITRYSCAQLPDGTQRCVENCSSLSKACSTAGLYCALYVAPPSWGTMTPYFCHAHCQSDADCKGLVYHADAGPTDCVCQSAGSTFAGQCGSVANAAVDAQLCRYPLPPP